MRYDCRRPIAARTLRRLDGKWPTAPLSYHPGQARPECQRRYVRNITSSSVKENHLATLFLFGRSCLISPFLFEQSCLISGARARADLPEAVPPYSWAKDRDRCREAGIPEDVEFGTKPLPTQAST